MIKTKGVDTSALLNKLRVLVGKQNLSVYSINIRRAGYGILYAGDANPEVPREVGSVVTMTVYTYYPTLRKAVIGELIAMSEPGGRSERIG